ncbi:TlpA family protein disulfide reductase [Dyadobacter alkalitolerans]|uniref:TlpA family protein disulfide reductase n=1 Tax=Dyadobacter alkalitolerans TaxID=492736 RepID=UPI000423FA65|nr:TlpA disulfide reductase family protein [Dyadobacter alkalitolerans]
MRQYVKLGFLSLILLTSLWSCDKKNSNHVTISIKLDSAKNARVDFVTNNMLSLDTLLLATSTLDSTGSGKIEVDIAGPLFAVVTSAGQYIPLYVNPGDDIVIEPDSGKSRKNVNYAGDGSTVNRFIKRSQDAQQQCEVTNGKYIIQIMDDAEFFARMDAFKKKHQELLNSLLTDKNVDPNTLKVMQSRKEMMEYHFYQKYTQSKYGYDMNDPAIPAKLLAPIKNLPEDSLALAINMYDYAAILANFLESNIFAQVAKQTEGRDPDSIAGKYPEIADSFIQEQPYSRQLKDHFRAANINFWVGMEGVSPELQKLRDLFNKEVDVPQYTTTLNKSFGIWERIGPGKPAPDFTGQTADGKNMSLSSLKGKVVYVDVWATWCGPCKEEFPHSKKLMKAFKGNDKVAFLFVSTDENVETWKKMLPDKSVPEGIHINQVQKNQPDDIWENYRIWGIPRYILIDADGKMLQTHAPRPSSGKVEDLLRQTIKI